MFRDCQRHMTNPSADIDDLASRRQLTPIIPYVIFQGGGNPQKGDGARLPMSSPPAQFLASRRQILIQDTDSAVPASMPTSAPLSQMQR